MPSRRRVSLPVAAQGTQVRPARARRGWGHSSGARPAARARCRAGTDWPDPSTNSAPPLTGSPSQPAASTRLKWPCPTVTTGPVSSAVRTRASIRSARAPTSAAVSPPGGSPVQIVQPGRLVADVRGGHALVLAVRPLGQVLGHLDRADVAEAGQLGRADRPAARAGEHGGRTDARQQRGQGPRLLLAHGGERHVGRRWCAGRCGTTRSRRAGRRTVARERARPAPGRCRPRRGGS